MAMGDYTVGPDDECREVRHFESIQDAVRDAKREDNVTRTGNLASRESGRGHSWDFGVGFEGMVDLCQTGWIEGLERIREEKKALYSMVGQPSYSRETYRPHVVGQTVNVPAVVNGRPDTMIQRQQEQGTGAQGTIINVCLSLGASCGVDAEALYHRGACLTALIEQLEARGFRVGFEAHEVQWQDNFDGFYGLCEYVVKRPDQPIDMEMIAAVAAHPGFFRRIQFANMERFEDHDLANAFSYGKPTDFDEELQDEHGYDIYLGAEVLGEIDWDDLSQVRQWLSDQLDACGVELDWEEE